MIVLDQQGTWVGREGGGVGISDFRAFLSRDAVFIQYQDRGQHSRLRVQCL